MSNGFYVILVEASATNNDISRINILQKSQYNRCYTEWSRWQTNPIKKTPFEIVKSVLVKRTESKRITYFGLFLY